MSWWRLFYHLVWATKGREPLIDGQRAEAIDRAIREHCREADIIVHAVGFLPDHVHLAVSIPPRLAIATVVRQLKGAASHLLNHTPPHPGGGSFFWQAEYGVLSFGERSLDSIIAYIQDQRAHPAADNLWPSFEITERPYESVNGRSPAPDLSPGGASSVEPGPSAPGASAASSQSETTSSVLPSKCLPLTP